MTHQLQELFGRALDDQPRTPAADAVREAMARGRRIRRRHSLLMGGSAAAAVGALAVGSVVALTPQTAPAPAAATPSVVGQATKTDVLVYPNPAITTAERRSLESALRDDPAVLHYVRLAPVRPGSAPAPRDYYRVALRDADPRAFSARISRAAGVHAVTTEQCRPAEQALLGCVEIPQPIRPSA